MVKYNWLDNLIQDELNNNHDAQAIAQRIATAPRLVAAIQQGLTQGHPVRDVGEGNQPVLGPSRATTIRQLYINACIGD